MGYFIPVQEIKFNKNDHCEPYREDSFGSLLSPDYESVAKPENGGFISQADALESKDSLEPLLRPDDYESVAKPENGGFISQAHALEIDLKKNRICAYVVTLEGCEQKVTIAAEKIGTLERGKVLEEKGKRILKAYRKWRNRTSKCTSKSDYRAPVWRKYYPYPSYAEPTEDWFQVHKDPLRGEDVISQALWMETIGR